MLRTKLPAQQHRAALKRGCRHLVTLLAFGLTTLPRIAAAQDAAAEPAQPEEKESSAVRAEAHQRFDKGLQLFNSGDNDGALAEFRRAYELVANPLVLFNIGLVLVAMNQPVQAVAAFDQLLSAPGQLDAEHLARAREERARQLASVGEIILDCSVPGAQIEVDGFDVGKAPLSAPLRVAGGSHVIGAVAPGYHSQKREVTVAGGAQVQLTLELMPLEAPRPKPARSEPSGARAQSAARMPVPVATEPSNAVDENGTPRTLAWLALGAGGVGLGISGITTLLALGKCGDDSCPPQRSQREDVDGYDTLRTTSTVSFFAGALLGGTGAVLLLTTGQPEDTGVALQVSPGAAMLKGRF